MNEKDIVCINFDVGLVRRKKFKLKCIRDNVSMTEKIRELMDKYLEEE